MLYSNVVRTLVLYLSGKEAAVMELLQILWDRRDFFASCLGEHIRISLTAVAFAGMLGILTGTFISRHKKAAAVVLGFINVVYTIPSISLLGFLIPFTGIGNKTAVIALTVYGLLPIVRNTYTGLSNVEAGILEVAEGLGADRRQLLLGIQFPMALPVIISGFRNMVVRLQSASGPPFMNTSPRAGVTSPFTILRSVVFPQPEGPMMVRNSPFSTVRETSCKTSLPP